jgi:N-acetylmuramoyl-L-alanine amidase
MASKYIWLLDNGHGGIINGEYQTPGKRSPVWPDGTQLFEGEFNRAIVKRLITLCDKNGTEYKNIVPEEMDISRRERVKRANDIYKNDRRCIYLSIHANAGGGEGWEIFTSRGETKSDKIATVFFKKIEEEFPQIRMRPDYLDGDSDKEEQFDVLVNTKMPAVLTENFFMDNEEECKKYLMSEESRDRIAKAHFNAILEIENLNI